MSFLGLEGLHVFITGSAGGIGSQAVTEFLSTFHLGHIRRIGYPSNTSVDQGCKVTAHDLRPIQRPSSPHLHTLQGNISDETSVRSCITSAKQRFGALNVLIANAGFPKHLYHCS